MTTRSAGIVLYRAAGDSIEILLVHPGGPYWAKKDLGAWSIPKGKCEPDEDPLAAARREFREETGFDVDGDFVPLTTVRLSSGKLVSAWAVEGTIDVSRVVSNTFTMEWPPGSGLQAEFPEVDRAGWFSPSLARRKLTPGQAPFVTALCELLDLPDDGSAPSS